MEKQVEDLVLNIRRLKKRLTKKEEELAMIQKNCQHSLSEKFEIQPIIKVENFEEFQLEEKNFCVFHICQKCGKKIFIN